MSKDRCKELYCWKTQLGEHIGRVWKPGPEQSVKSEGEEPGRLQGRREHTVGSPELSRSFLGRRDGEEHFTWRELEALSIS